MLLRDAETAEQWDAAMKKLEEHCRGLAPDAIIDTEFDVRLGNEDLIESIIDLQVESASDPMCADLFSGGPQTREQAQAWWDALSDLEKRVQQVMFVAPPHCLF